MDKYTVDLDQVLNDFEYSELTDQHGFSEGHGRGGSRTAPYLSNNRRNSSGKHSMNNVFHSLNEYLNTEISPKYEPAVPIQLVQQELAAKPEEVAAAPESPTARCEANAKIEAPVEHEEEVSVEPDVATITPEPLIEIDIPIEVKTETLLPARESSESSIETIDKSSDDLDEARESVEEIIEDIFEEATEERSDETGDGQPARANQKFEITIEDSVTRIGFDDTLDLDESELHRYLDELEKEYESQYQDVQEKEEEKEADTKNNLEEIVKENEKEEDVIKQEETEEKRATQAEEVEVTQETEMIGIQKEPISEAEQETKEPSVEVFAKEVVMPEVSEVRTFEDVEKEVTEQIGTIEEDVPAAEQARPNNLSLQVPDEKSVIDLIGDPGSTPYNNVYVNKELPQGNSEDTSSSASPTFSDISTDTTSSCTPSTDTVNDEVPDLPKPAQMERKSDTEEGTGNLEEESASSHAEPVMSTECVEEEGENSESNTGESWLGKHAPVWIPDADATACLHCDMRFTVLKRRHHCRACGLVLCSKCCSMKFRLEYMDDVARVCNKCFEVLSKGAGGACAATSSSGSESSSPKHQPNPNNPAEYCSTVPPMQQMAAPGSTSPPSVMVPVGVLKRKGSNKTRTNKSVMFCDGIRPGSDLTSLDSDFGYTAAVPSLEVRQNVNVPAKTNNEKVVDEKDKRENRNLPVLDPETKSFIPGGERLPPVTIISKNDVTYTEVTNGPSLVDTLRKEMLTFSLQLNLYIHVKIINMDCCINKVAWCFSTEGLINVGQDEIVILLEVLEDETKLPKDIFLYLNNIYADAVKGNAVKEMGLSLHNSSLFLDSKNHAGFVYIRPTFQCLQNVIKPKEPFLVGILIHRWETPWAKLFPLRLVLRLGAEYRYYPSPIISNRNRDSVFVEIGHTIINLLADFRNFTYTLPQIRGLTIHMEDKNTKVTIPLNRYDQVMKSMNNSSDHILAFAGNFSSQADSHLVCIQDTHSNENAYSTHAINIHNKPRKVTGASFIVFNGALKSSSGLTAKSSIVEDGLMIQIPPEQMVQIRESLRNMKNHTIQCGCINAASDETVDIVWGDSDFHFNTNVVSPIDEKSMAGVPSIRVHNGKDYVCNSGNRLIRWTEVFIIQNAEESNRNQEPVDVSKVSENIAKATCAALVKYLDLLVSNNFYKIGIRATLDVENVSYSAGSNAMKLPPIYMKSLDNELVPVLHIITSNNFTEHAIILELIFRILIK